jgi:hypothetical protein
MTEQCEMSPIGWKEKLDQALHLVRLAVLSGPYPESGS